MGEFGIWSVFDEEGFLIRTRRNPHGLYSNPRGATNVASQLRNKAKRQGYDREFTVKRAIIREWVPA